MEFADFLKKQDEVYEKFSKSKVKEKGFIPNLPQVEEGNVVYFRHPEIIRKKVADFSKKISKYVESLVYDESKVHTTISFDQDCNSPLCKDKIKRLLKILSDIERQLKKCSIKYKDWACN